MATCMQQLAPVVTVDFARSDFARRGFCHLIFWLFMYFFPCTYMHCRGYSDLYCPGKHIVLQMDETLLL